MFEFLAENMYLFYGLVLLMTIASAAIGTGGGAMLIPLAAIVYGSKEAVGIITLYFLFQNINKYVIFRDHIDWNITWKMTYWSVPSAIAGAYLLSYIPAELFNKLLGLFMLIFIANDVFKLVPMKHYTEKMIPVFGAIYGLLSGLLSSGGLMKGPLFTTLGLRKERYIGTSAVTSFFVNVPKIAVYIFTGIIVGKTFVPAIPFLFISIIGTYIGKNFLRHVGHDVFYYILNITFAISAVALFLGK